MKKKIIKTYLFLSIAILIVTGVFFATVISSFYVEDLKEQLKLECSGLKEVYEIGGLERLASTSSRSVSRVTVIDGDGVVLYDDLEDASVMDNHGDRDEFISAKENGYGESTRTSDTLSESRYYYAEVLSDGNVVRISRSVSNLFGVAIMSVPWLILGVVLILIVVMLVSKYLTNNIVKPINNIDLNAPIENEVYGELTPLLRRMDQQNKKIGEQISIIEKKQREFNDLILNMTDGLLVIGETGKLTVINETARILFECEIGFSYVAIFREVSLIETVEKALQGEVVVSVISLNGSDYEMRLNPIESEHGYSVLAIFIDVTEKIKTEKIRSEFSSNVTHELKTPLTSIMGYSELIANGIVKDDDIVEIGGKISKESKRLYRLIEDILTISKLDEKHSSLVENKISVQTVAMEVVHELSELSQQKSVRIDITGDDFSINSDSTRLHQIIFNLVNNGINYNKENGMVEIKLCKDKSLEVIDNGIGISKEELPRLTERFYRVDKSRSKDTGGTGLGLAIVKHSVECLGGTLAIESNVGGGTKVKISFRQFN